MNTEQEVAAAVVEWLTAEGWEIYQEVVTPCGRADIVAVQGSLRWAIEVKTTLTLTVLDQAMRNAPYFHLSSYAVPAPAKLPHGTSRGWAFAHEIAKSKGFGALRVLPERPRHHRVIQDVAPHLNRKPCLVQLHEGQKTAAAAGSAAGGHWTPFRNTTQLLTAEVQRKPGMPLRDVVKLISHHYSNDAGACRRISEMIKQRVITDVQLQDGKLYLAANG